MKVVLLGPVEVSVNGAGVRLAPLERNLLAMLALAAGVSSTERIIDGLWGERTPASARSRVQGLVSGLRRKLGEDEIVTRPPGYLLRSSDGGTDLSHCIALTRLARAAEAPAEAVGPLREALDLWRGEPLDGASAPGLDGERARLAEMRIGLLEERFEAELALGCHAEVVGELIAAVAAHPLRERLAGQLMLALYRCNRQADALGVYRSLRERLAEELGGDPCADVRELHGMILRGAAAPPAAAVGGATASAEGSQAVPGVHRPAQTPPSAGHFTGRANELDWLSAQVPGDGEEPRVLVVSGAAGLGKTALVVRWAHEAGGGFADGQVFVDLRGGDRRRALSPGAALGAVLSALGVPAAALPVNVEERAALYRTTVHDRRLLIIADDAASVPQLLPLVPPTPGSLVVVTSRKRLPALAAHHAVRTLVLDPLAAEPSTRLLRSIAGPDRLPPASAATLAGLCAGWPLALRLAGATLAARSRQSPESFAAELRERVDELSVADDPRTVGTGLAEAHDTMDPASARLFAQLGLLPPAPACLHLAAAAAGTSVLRARRLLDELIAANLVAEAGPDRYMLHEMIRRYARRRAAALPDRPVVEERIARWYAGAYDGAARAAEPDRDRPPVPAETAWIPYGAGDAAGARRFLAEEAPHFPAILAWAAERDPALAWRLLADAHAAGAPVTAADCELGLDAARALDDGYAAGEAHGRLGLVLLGDPERLDEAERHLTLAAGLLDPGTGRLASIAAFALAGLRTLRSRAAEARHGLEYALRFLDPGREPLSYAVVLLAYARTLVISGCADRGHERFAQALILCQATTGRGGDRLGRFDGGRPYLSRQLAAEYLEHIAGSLDAPRVTPADRTVAAKLVAAARSLASAAETRPATDVRPAERRPADARRPQRI